MRPEELLVREDRVSFLKLFVHQFAHWLRLLCVLKRVVAELLLGVDRLKPLQREKVLESGDLLSLHRSGLLDATCDQVVNVGLLLWSQDDWLLFC